ncbi:hypothetical protein JXB01_04255 [Candidatus Micrarchaeota archaeon]|nr:hypothetical protein [Candidatus Micrarchaeota archaeon]
MGVIGAEETKKKKLIPKKKEEKPGVKIKKFVKTVHKKNIQTFKEFMKEGKYSKAYEITQNWKISNEIVKKAVENAVVSEVAKGDIDQARDVANMFQMLNPKFMKKTVMAGLPKAINAAKVTPEFMAGVTDFLSSKEVDIAFEKAISKAKKYTLSAKEKEKFDNLFKKEMVSDYLFVQAKHLQKYGPKAWIGYNSKDLAEFQYIYNKLIDAKIVSGKKLKVDGIWGDKTSAAIKNLQKKIVAKADGKPGYDTYRQLVQYYADQGNKRAGQLIAKLPVAKKTKKHWEDWTKATLKKEKTKEKEGTKEETKKKENVVGGAGTTP